MNTSNFNCLSIIWAIWASSLSLDYASASETPINGSQANRDGAERCLIGDPANGLCAGEGTLYAGHPSILNLIQKDLEQELGSPGKFERVSDRADKIWKYLVGDRQRSGARVRARYGGKSLIFGWLRGSSEKLDASNFLVERVEVGGAKRNSVFLNDCKLLRKAEENLRLKKFDSCEQTSIEPFSVMALLEREELFRPAIYSYSRKRYLSSNPVDNQIKCGINYLCAEGVNHQEMRKRVMDHMVTFKFIPANANASSEVRYILAFEDNIADPLSVGDSPMGDMDYNDYVVELIFAEPIALSQ